ncbi:AMP-binding protein [Bradyrhizobium sp. HKCCYLS2038]|uniref:AMP-binding protein n=1 Tax=unclassified Bradyrhizobium TaxID=2631580 RepID=UPI003EBE8C74
MKIKNIHAAVDKGDRLALKCGAKTRTFCEFEDRTDRLASALIARGLQSGQRLASICRNSIELVEAAIAAEKAGLRFTIINPVAGRHDLEAELLCCAPHALIINMPVSDEVMTLLAPFETKLHVQAVPGFLSYEDVLADAPAGSLPERVAGLAMPLTSGTTGRPKAVFRKHPYVPPYLRQLLAVTAFVPETDLAFAPGGVQASGVLNLAVRLPLRAGVGVLISDLTVTMEADAEDVLRTIERERVTHLYLPNYLMRQLMQLPEQVRQSYDVRSLRCVLHGGSPSPRQIKRALIAWLGPIVTEFYAGAEGGGTLITSAEWLQHEGSVGRPQPGLVCILNEDGVACEPGEHGLIYFRLARYQRFTYLNNPAATEAVHRCDFFTLGDRGYLDDEGYLYLAGRTAEVIDFSGNNVMPAEVDEVLLAHPAVAACAACGIPDAKFGEIVGAVIVLRPGFAPTVAQAEEIWRWCRSRLTISKCPRQLVFSDDLPGFGQGKINRRSLVPLFATGAMTWTYQEAASDSTAAPSPGEELTDAPG